MEKRPATPGETIAYRAGGAILVYDSTNEDGIEFGHIVTADGETTPIRPLLSLLVRGYWHAEPVDQTG